MIYYDTIYTDYVDEEFIAQLRKEKEEWLKQRELQAKAEIKLEEGENEN